MGKMFRSVLAVLAGYLVMAVLVVIASGVLFMAFGAAFIGPDGKPRLPEPVAPWYAVNLAYSFLFAVAAGYLTTWIARDRGMSHAAALAGLMAVISVVSIFAPRDIPAWWTLGELVVGIIGVLLGGFLRARRGSRSAIVA